MFWKLYAVWLFIGALIHIGSGDGDIVRWVCLWAGVGAPILLVVYYSDTRSSRNR